MNIIKAIFVLMDEEFDRYLVANVEVEVGASVEFVEFIAVDSSNIAAIGYNQRLLCLFVRFISGATYMYYDVPASVYSLLIFPDVITSVGRAFNILVKKGGYHYKRL